MSGVSGIVVIDVEAVIHGADHDVAVGGFHALEVLDGELDDRAARTFAEKPLDLRRERDDRHCSVG